MRAPAAPDGIWILEALKSIFHVCAQNPNFVQNGQSAVPAGSKCVSGFREAIRTNLESRPMWFHREIESAQSRSGDPNLPPWRFRSAIAIAQTLYALRNASEQICARCGSVWNLKAPRRYTEGFYTSALTGNSYPMCFRLEIWAKFTHG